MKDAWQKRRAAARPARIAQLVVGSGALAWIGLAPVPAWADDDVAAAGTAVEASSRAIPEVTLTVVGAAPNADALLVRVSSWFSRETPRTHGSRQSKLDAGAVFAEHDAPGLWVWIWLREPGSTRLFFRVATARGEAPRFLVAEVPLAHGLDEVGLEQIGQVVYSSAQALWAGDPGSRREIVEAGLASEPEPVVPSKRSDGDTSRLTVRLGLEDALRWAGPEGAVQTPSAVASFSAASSTREVGVALRTGVILPRELHRADLELHLVGAAVALQGQAAFRAGKSVWLGGALGPALEVLSFDPVSARPSAVQAAGAGVDFRPLLLAAGQARFELGPIGILAGLLLGLELVRTHYDEVTTEGQKAVLVPWLIQPGAALGVLW